MGKWPIWCSLQQLLLYAVDGRPPISDELHQAVASVCPLPPVPLELVMILREGHVVSVGAVASSPMDSDDFRISDSGRDIPPDYWVPDKIDWRNSRLSIPDPGVFSNAEFRNIKIRTTGLRKELEQRMTRPNQKGSPAKLKTGPKEFDYDGKFWPEVVALALSEGRLPDVMDKCAHELAALLDGQIGLTQIKAKLGPLYRHPAIKGDH